MNPPVRENSRAFNLPSHDLTNFPESTSPQTTGEKYLVFFLGEEFFAISSKKVAEVASSLPVSVLPFAPEWLLGIANLRGEVVSIVNLFVLLRKKPSVPSPKSKLIILRSPIFEFGAALVVDRISEIVALPDNEIQPVYNDDAAYIRGESNYKSQPLNLINTEKLLASLRI